MPWTEEIAIYSMTYMALLGTEVGLRDGTQVAVTAVVDKLHGVTRKIVDLIRQVILVGFAFIMIKAGGDVYKRQALEAAWDLCWPVWVPQWEWAISGCFRTA